MKGISWLLWLTLTLIMMGIIGIFIWQSVSGFIGEAIANNAKMTGQRIEAIVNDLQASPSGTVYSYQLPKVKGQLVFQGSRLGVKISANVDRFYNDTHFIEHYPMHYDQSGVLVMNFDAQNRDLFLARCGDEIFVAQARDKIPCS